MLYKRINVALTFAVIILLVFMSFGLKVNVAQGQTEYQSYVLNNLYSSTWGNYTYLEKPGFPVYIANNSIPIGQNYTIICPLQANHMYHIYLYGAYISNGSSALTDYDVYVYNPDGTLESAHTPAAGVAPNLGTTVDDPYFIPEFTGNYTFVISNDVGESHGSEAASFMIMEHAECDTWYSLFVQGMNGDQSQYNTNWAFEFVTNSSQIEVYVNVPDSLDMYEARLYLMSDSSSMQLNGVILPVESALYGNITDVGGYNMDSGSYQGIIYASSEFSGQDMFINYTSNSAASSSLKVYHLVFMGHSGSGTIQFLVKTSFDDEALTPLTTPIRVTPNNETLISYTTNTTALENATLQYTTDNWETATEINMARDNMTCNATIPQQQAGSLVQYEIQACDTLENELTASGNFAVKDTATITQFNALRSSVSDGNNITVTGTISIGNAPINITCMSVKSEESIQCTSLDNGTFTASFQPSGTGTYLLQATFLGSNDTYPCNSNEIQVTVNGPSFIDAYGLYIGLGLIGGLSAAVAVMYVKSIRQ